MVINYEYRDKSLCNSTIVSVAVSQYNCTFLLIFFSLYFLHPSITLVFVIFCKCELFLWKLNYILNNSEFHSLFFCHRGQARFAINVNVNTKVTLIESNVILLIEYSILVAIPKCTHLLWSYYAFSQLYRGKMLSLW